MELRISRSPSLHGAIRPPSDKSLTHRALMLAAAATSECEIRHPLRGADCESTRSALTRFGMRTILDEPERFVVAPPKEWQSTMGTVDCGNSGTTMRLLSGMIASRQMEVLLGGDASLSRRPMERITRPLKLMGASIQGDTAPLSIQGGQLHGIEYTSPIASAQVKSCLLLAGLRAEGQTWIKEPALSRDHTERMLHSLGVKLKRDPSRGIGVERVDPWPGFSVTIPADISSAAFWMVAALLLDGSQVRLLQVGVNPTRTGILDVLDKMRAAVSLDGAAESLGEPYATISITSGTSLKPLEIAGSLVPRLIDEIPILAVLATQALGQSVIRDAQELRVKETDRIATVCAGLTAMGAKIEPTADGMIIDGPTPLHGATIDAQHDHRIGMAFAIAGMIAEGETVIEGAESIQTSYPDFMEDWAKLRRVG